MYKDRGYFEPQKLTLSHVNTQNYAFSLEYQSQFKKFAVPYSGTNHAYLSDFNTDFGEKTRIALRNTHFFSKFAD